MSTSPRPIDCCEPSTEVDPLPVEERHQVVALFKALGDGTRLEVFRLIAAQNQGICVCDIVDRFDVSQPTISHHLKVLRDADLIAVSRRGNWAFYSANRQKLRLISGLFTESVVLSPIS